MQAPEADVDPSDYLPVSLSGLLLHSSSLWPDSQEEDGGTPGISFTTSSGATSGSGATATTSSDKVDGEEDEEDSQGIFARIVAKALLPHDGGTIASSKPQKLEDEGLPSSIQKTAVPPERPGSLWDGKDSRASLHRRFSYDETIPVTN